MQQNPVSDKRQRHAVYASTLPLPLRRRFRRVRSLVDWLSPLGPVVNALLAAVAAYLTILVGQRVLGQEESVAMRV